MYLSLSETEELLADYVRSFVRRDVTTETLVALQNSELGHRPDWTSKMADAGWLGALVPSECGGGDATCLQAAVIWEELGRAPLPGPYFMSSVVATLLLRAAEPGGQRDELLSGIAAGEAVVTLVPGPAGQDWNGFRDSGSLIPVTGGGLSGTFPYVPYAQAATHFLLPVRRDGEIGFAVVPAKAPGIDIRRLPGFLAWNDEVSLSGVSLEQDVLRCPADGVSEALARAYTLLAAYTVGGCQALLERSVEYSNTRVQFGMVIGRFQRVQDHIVELVNALDAARWITYDALWRLDSGQDGVARAHMAKAVASESYITCTDAAHKVHGGIGVDPDYGLTLYTQMARSLYNLLGSPRWHKRRMADALWRAEPSASQAGAPAGTPDRRSETHA
jgi:alkylation response protein AidB-like acyl-CoA dehydrogenase